MEVVACACGNPVRWRYVDNEISTTDGLCSSCAAKAREDRLKNSEFTVEKLIEKLKMLDPKKKIFVLDPEYGPWVVREVKEDVVEDQDVIMLDG